MYTIDVGYCVGLINENHPIIGIMDTLKSNIIAEFVIHDRNIFHPLAIFGFSGFDETESKHDQKS